MKKKAKKTSKAQRRAGGSLDALVRLIRPHARDCAALAAVKQGRWETPWTGLVEEVQWLDKRGGKRGNTHAWLIVRCNSTRCDALKKVPAEYLAKAGGV